MQSSCIEQSEIKKDIRIAFPRFNPQRAAGAGSFPSERINKSVSGIYGDGERECEERLHFILVLRSFAR